MKQMPRTVLLGLPLLAAVCVALGSWMAAGADTRVTVPAQSGVAPLEADLQKDVSKVESQAAKEEHGLPQAAVPVLNKLGRLPITNSMVVSWIVAVGLIVFAQVATRKMQRVPAGAQNFWEWLVESLYEFPRGHHWPAPGEADVLVLCHDLHLHSCRQLGGPHPRGRHHRVGRAGRRTVSRLRNPCSAGPTPIST